uniref:Ig-like domain-containing protein n=1 Tax=Plectus sambesii TaxID=2011161 RepID=A0A914XK67_9BILA
MYASRALGAERVWVHRARSLGGGRRAGGLRRLFSGSTDLGTVSVRLCSRTGSPTMSAPTITHFAKVEENGFEGQELHLVCQGIGKPTPEYKWFKGSPDDKGATPLEPTDKYEFPEPGALTIQALIEDDAGQYTCVASNDIAEARNSTEVKIFRKPKIAVMENVTATQGMKVELVCKYEGDGEVTAKWIFKGESIEAESSDSKPVSQHVDVNDDS